MKTKPIRRLPQILGTWILNSAVFLSSVLLSLLGGEFGLRVIDDKRVLECCNWLEEISVHEDISGLVSYDSTLGWRMKAGYRSPGMNTGPYGLRFTTETAPRIVPGGIVALAAFLTLPNGFSNAALRPHVAQLMAKHPAAYRPAQMTYDLRRLRLHGLIERIPHSQRYTLTPMGRRIAIFFSKLYTRLFLPGLGSLFDQAPDSVTKAITKTMQRLDQQIDSLVHNLTITV